MMETRAIEDTAGAGIHDVIVAHLMSESGVTPVVILRTLDLAGERATEWIMEKEVVADLKKVGYVFSLLFLPTANLLALGVILSFAHSGLRATGEFLRTAVARMVWPW